MNHQNKNKKDPNRRSLPCVESPSLWGEPEQFLLQLFSQQYTIKYFMKLIKFAYL